MRLSFSSWWWLLAGVLGALAAGLTWASAQREWGPGTWLDALRRGPDLTLAYKHSPSTGAQPAQPLLMQVFRARGQSPGPQAPLVLLVHGGGWVTGDIRQFHPQCRFFSARGLDCVAVAYRVRSQHGSTPGDALDDLRDAVRFLRRHHSSLNLPLQRLVVGGGSAGGHLAAGLASPLPWPDPGADPATPTRPDAVLLYNPMLDLSPGMPDHGPVAAHWQALSPQHHLSAATSPTLVMSGDHDPEVAVATVQTHVQRLQALGVNARAVTYPGAGHGFFNPGAGRMAWFHQTNDEAWRFLAELGWVGAMPPR